MPAMQLILLNLARPRFRKTTHNGEEYIVVPLRMIVPGVLPGSQGPLYYPPEEIAHNYQQWDGIPVTLYHPTTTNGQGLSAKAPGVLAKQGIGIIKNPRVDNKGLRAEAWLNVAKTKRLAPEILRNVYAGRPVEISTGLYTDNHRANNGANYRGRGYTHVARNYRADHLAILPGQRGACSLDDGCGLLQNVESEYKRLGLGVTNGGPGSGPHKGSGTNVHGTAKQFYERKIAGHQAEIDRHLTTIKSGRLLPHQVKATMGVVKQQKEKIKEAKTKIKELESTQNQWVTTEKGNKLFIEDGEAKTGPDGKSVAGKGKGKGSGDSKFEKHDKKFQAGDKAADKAAKKAGFKDHAAHEQAKMDAHYAKHDAARAKAKQEAQAGERVTPFKSKLGSGTPQSAPSKSESKPSLFSRFKKALFGEHGLGFNQMKTLGLGLGVMNCGGEGGTMGPCPGSGKGSVDSKERIAKQNEEDHATLKNLASKVPSLSGRKWDAADGFLSSSGRVVDRKTTNKELDSVFGKPTQTERGGTDRYYKVGSNSIMVQYDPHDKGFVQMHVWERDGKNSYDRIVGNEKDQATGKFLSLGAGNGRGEPHEAAKRGARTIYDSVLMPEVEEGDIDDADTEDAGFTAEDDGETTQNGGPGSGPHKGGGSASKFSKGDKVTISGGIFQGKKAKVVEHTDEGVLVKFPDRKERNGSISKGATTLIPHSTDKPTMTTSKHLTKNSECECGGTCDECRGENMQTHNGGPGSGPQKGGDSNSPYYRDRSSHASDLSTKAKTLSRSNDPIASKAHAEAADAHEKARAISRDPKLKGRAEYHTEMIKFHREKAATTNGRSGQSTVRNKESQKMAKLTEEDREVIIGNLCTNCECEQANVFNEEDAELLANMSDATLLGLAEQRDTLAANNLVINQIRTKFKVGKAVTLNALPGALATQQGQKVPPKMRPEEASTEEANVDEVEEDTEEEGTVRPRGEEQAMNRRIGLSREDRATLNWAREERERQKQELIQQLTANMSCDDDEAEETLNELNDMPLEQVQKIARIAPRRPTRNAAQSAQQGYGNGFVGFAPPAPQQRRPNYAGAGVIPTRNRMTENQGEQGDTLDIPTLNAAELSPLYKKLSNGSN